MTILTMQGLLAIHERQHELEWQPFRPGITCYPIYQTAEGAAAMLLRYEPGARAPHHIHQGYEHILVLSGSQTDAVGHHPAGSLVIHPAGTVHDVYSEDGCIVLAIWEKQVRFAEPTTSPQQDSLTS